MSSFTISTILQDSDLTVYGLAQKIQGKTGEDIKAVHKRLKKWQKTGTPPKFQLLSRDVGALGYEIKLVKKSEI